MMSYSHCKAIELFTLSFLIILTSCRPSSTNNQNNRANINLSAPVQQDLNMSTFISDIQYVPLETTDENLIGNINQLLLTDDKMIVVDQKTASIFFFDHKGKYLYKIAEQGIGPGQYTQINGAAINHKKKEVYVLDRKKVHVYTIEGNFDKTIQLDFLANDFICADHSLVFYCDYGRNNHISKDNQTPLLAIYDLQTSDTHYFLYQDSSIDLIEIIDYHMLRNYSGREEGILTFPLSDEVYQLTSDGVSPKYSIDFGKANLEKKKAHLSMLKEERLSTEDGLEGGKGYPDFWEIQGCLESDSVLFIGYNNYAEHKTGVYLRDKRSNKQLSGYSSNGWVIKNDIDKGYPLLPLALEGSKFYTIVPPFYLQEMKSENPQLRNIIENLTGEENPILMVSSVKID